MLPYTEWLHWKSRAIFAPVTSWEGTTVSEPAESQAAHESEPLLRAVNVSKRSIVASRVWWAGTSDTRRRGLLGRQRIAADEGMYIVPTQWIHMFGMRFPVDVAFLNAAGQVLLIHHVLKPNRLSRLVWRAEGALELAPGSLRATGTEVGDVIRFESVERSPGHTCVAPSFERDGTARGCAA